MADYPTITSDPSQPSESPEEDIGGGGYSSALGYSARNFAPGTSTDLSPALELELGMVGQTAPLISQPVPTDEEAGLIYERLPFLPDADRADALNRLNQYAADLEEKDLKKRAVEREYEFTDPKARAAWLNREDVRENIGYLDDSNAAYDRMAVKKLLETEVVKRPLSEPEYEAYRNDVVGRRWAGKPKISDQEAFGVIQKRVETEKEIKESLAFTDANVMKGLIESFGAGKPFRMGDAWDATRRKYSKVTEGREDELYAETARRYTAARSWIGENGPALATGLDYIRKWNAGTQTDEDTKAAIDALISIPPEKLNDALYVLTGAVKTEVADENVIKNAFKVIINEGKKLAGLTKLAVDDYTAANDLKLEAMAASLRDGKARLGGGGKVVFFPVEERDVAPPGPPLTPEQTSAAMAEVERGLGANRIWRAFRRITEPQFEPHLFTKGTPAYIERSLFGAYENFAPMVIAGARFSGLGYPLYMATIVPSAYEQTMFENPLMDKRVATGMALVEGNINFVGDNLEFKAFKGAGLSRYVKELLGTGTAGKLAGRGLGMWGVETVIEQGQDFFSDLGKSALQDIIHRVKPDINVGQIKSLDAAMADSWKNLPETAGQMFFLSAFGVGILTYRDVKDPQKTTYNLESLRATGMDERTINSLLWETDFAERDQMYQEAFSKLTPKQRADGILYQQEQAAAIRAKVATGGATTTEDPAVAEEAFKPPTLVEAKRPDGTRAFNLLDGDGNVVREDMNEEVAAAEHEDLVRTSFGEYLQKQVEARQTEEAEAKGVAAETKWSILSAREKTTLGNILEYEYVKQPTPEQQKSVEGLKRALGKPDSDIVAVSVDQPTTRAGKQALNFVRWYEDTFKKNVVFVASASGESLSFDGAVNSSDPDTIFLNAAGNRNVLSLLGHEWSHTLEKTNPKLWNDVMERMQPMIMDWAVQVGKVDASYDPGERTQEFVANVIGDAFGDPEFWKVVREKDANLFQRMLQAVQDWFDNLIVHESEWGTQEFVKDLKGLRDLVAEAMRTAEAGPEEILPATLEEEFAQLAASRESGHKFGTRGLRQVDENGGYVTPTEETKVDASINELLTKAGHKGAKRRRLFEKARAQVLADIRSRRAANPDVNTGAADPWDTMSVTGTDLEVLGEKEEDVKATAIWQKQGYRFDQVPEGITRDQWRVELSNRVMAQFIERLQKGTAPGATKEQRAGAALILKEIEWYRDFTVRLRQDFGGAADFMADLLGAFSPRQNVRLNVRNAVDAIWAIHTGKYDQLFKDLDAYLKADPARTIKTWRKDDGRMMKARSGNLFGTNTELGMTAALGLWREIKAMDAPKAKNFTRNLIGLSIKATIDVWAARLLDRVGGKPRIPVDAETGVAGNHITEGQFKKLIQAEAKRIEETGSNQASPELLDLLEGNIPVTGQFAFGQEVFARVAELMRDQATWAGTGLSQEIIDKFKDVTPADVQAMNWFLEKEIWTENDWTNEEGAGGSFLHEIEQLLGTRFQFGLTQATKKWVPNDPDQARFIADVHADLISAMPEVLALRIMDSFGMYKGDKERSLDLEFTTSPGMEPNDIMRIALKHASAKGQEATHISRVMEEWEEDGPNDRPGVEIYLKAGSELSALDPVMKMLEARGLNGFTLIVDSRAKMGSNEYIGVRLQYVPEYSKDGAKWAKKADKVEKAIQKALREEIKALPEVLYAKLVWYDTIVFQENIDYDKEGPNSGALGTVEARAWRRRYFDYMAKKAVRRDEREKLLESQHPADVPAREPTEGPTGVAPPETVPVTAFDKDAGTFVPTPMKPTRELLKQLRVEQRTYSDLLKCLAA